jgi:hypothetical protein
MVEGPSTTGPVSTRSTVMSEAQRHYRVELANLDGVGLIVAAETKVWYANQTGGHACLQSELEGFYVPFNNGWPTSDDRSTKAQLSSLLTNVRGLTLEMAHWIDSGILASSGETASARVDRSRLADSHEAWVYVDLQPWHAGGPLCVPTPCKGVLTWENSD